MVFRCLLLTSLTIFSLAGGTKILAFHVQRSDKDPAKHPRSRNIMSQLNSANQSFRTAMEMLIMAKSSMSQMEYQAVSFLKSACDTLDTFKVSVDASSGKLLGDNVSKSLQGTIVSVSKSISGSSASTTKLATNAEANLSDIVSDLRLSHEQVLRSFAGASERAQRLTRAANEASSLLRNAGNHSTKMFQSILNAIDEGILPTMLAASNSECLSRHEAIRSASMLGQDGEHDEIVSEVNHLFNTLDKNQDNCLSDAEWTRRSRGETRSPRKNKFLNLLSSRSSKPFHRQHRSLEESLSNKEGACNKATAAVNKANVSVSKFESKIIMLNGIANSLLTAGTHEVKSGLGQVNENFTMVTSMVPPTVGSGPTLLMTGAASEALVVPYTITKQVESTRSQISARVVKALEPLRSLVALTNTMIADIINACPVNC